ncbi:MAG: DUF5615 family PIN-like protein [Candidatus Hydrogenedentes bacterium]|nr:DUF5615 family PIN-like protein [Candidatus Hydrogenedentota bacterium]
MKIMVDENVPSLTVETLVKLGHDVLDVRATEHKGDVAQREGRLFITTDLDFMKYRNNDHFGLLIVTLRQPNELSIHRRIMDGLREIAHEQWRGCVLVMKDRVRSCWRHRGRD